MIQGPPTRSTAPILIRTEDDLPAVVSAIAESGGPVGLDTETTGLDHATDLVRIISLALPGQTYVLDTWAIGDPCRSLSDLFDALHRVEVIGHHLGFDLPFLMRMGFVPGRVCCTMLASQVLWAGDITKRHGLKDLAARHLQLTVEKELQKADWSKSITREMVRYAALDAELPVRLWEAMLPLIQEAGLTRIVTDECRALPAVAWASRMGVALNVPAWRALLTAAEAKAEGLREQLDATAPNTENLFGATNWNSPDQVCEVFGQLGFTISTSCDAQLAEIDHPLAALLREYRSTSKLVGTYGREWLRHVRSDGRVYANWKQIGAGASGRMSCKEPNLQQIPRGSGYRKCFVAPPGRTLVKADYSQIELRIAAKISGDKRMIEAYRKNEDLHTITARMILGKTDVTKADRQIAKSLNFGLLYGMGAEGLRQYALGSFNVTLTDEQARDYRVAFFQCYPGLRKWHNSQSRVSIDSRTLAGRRRLSVNRFTEKLNTPVQGTGADGLKRALGLLWERWHQCPQGFPVLLVHDEIVVECPLGQEDAATAWVRGAMLDGMAPLIDPIPVEVEVSVGPTWGG